MLEHLDTAIAMTVVMLAVSLLITVLVQTVSALLGLRGYNLAMALADLISSIHPDYERNAKEIANTVLQHQLISDSTFVHWKRFPTFWKRAKAIRVEELVGILTKLGQQQQPRLSESLQKLPDDVQRPLKDTLNWVPQRLTDATQQLAKRTEQEAQDALQALNKAVAELGKVLGQDSAAPLNTAMAKIADTARPALGPQVYAVISQMRNLIDAIGTKDGQTQLPTNVQVQLAQLLERIPATTEAELSDLKGWFNTAMDRASQRFTTHVRIVTVLLSLAVAFILHLDASKLWSDLSSNSELRASLVQSSGAIERTATDILQKSAATASTPVADAAGQRPPPAPPANGGKVPAVYADTLRKLVKEENVKEATEAQVPVALASREAAVRWLRGHVQDASRLDPLSEKYQQMVSVSLTTEADRLLDRASSVRAILEDSKFRLIPDPYPSFSAYWPLLGNKHLYGVVFAAVLLSLGAPFWFNMLKNLTALRPIVAGKQEAEQKGQR